MKTKFTEVIHCGRNCNFLDKNGGRCTMLLEFLMRVNNCGDERFMKDEQCRNLVDFDNSDLFLSWVREGNIKFVEI